MYKAIYNFFFPAPKQQEPKTTFAQAIQSADDMRRAANDFTKAAKELTENYDDRR